jgi:hypothetical protein
MITTTTPVSREATIAGLIAMGWTETANPSTRKYRVFAHPDNPCKYLIGRSGALRKTGGTVAQSISLTGNRVHRAICEVGNGCFRFESTAQAEEVFARIMSS